MGLSRGGVYGGRNCWKIGKQDGVSLCVFYLGRHVVMVQRVRDVVLRSEGRDASNQDGHDTFCRERELGFESVGP